MHNTRISPLFRLTAAGLTLSLVSVTFSPLAHAQAAAEPKPPGASATAKPADAPAATPAPAAKPPDKKTRDAARKAYSGAEKAFAAGDFAAAQTGFEQANNLIPAPQAEYWIAKSVEAQPDKTQEAIAAYERFLANPDAAKAGEDKIADAKTRIQELKAKLIAQIDLLTMPSGATVLVDGNPEPGATPLTLKLAPGPHKLTISAPEYETKEIDVEVKAGEKIEQRVELAAKAVPPPEPPPAPPVAPPPPPPPPPEPRSMVPAFVTLGIAAGGLA
ncbi:MAG TPA: PEGA domain-containing protein, partial [Polyangiaceae bacterium]